MSAPTIPNAQFQVIAAAKGVLKNPEIEKLIEYCDAHATAGALSGGVRQDRYRRSEIAWLKKEQGFGWAYDRVAQLANGFNQRFFGFELTGIEQALQVARYEASPGAGSSVAQAPVGGGDAKPVDAKGGGYDWHTDFSVAEQGRKLSISIQLSDPAAYQGGDLEFDVSTEITKPGRDRGLAIAFPSFVRHRVSPVTFGVRYSLVAWVHGPRWR